YHHPPDLPSFPTRRSSDLPFGSLTLILAGGASCDLSRFAPWRQPIETHDHLVFDSPRNPLQSNFELGSHEALLLKCVFLKADNAGTFDRTSVGKPRRPNHPLSHDRPAELS